MPQQRNAKDHPISTFWSKTPAELCNELHCTAAGLASDDARRRLAPVSARTARERKFSARLDLLVSQFKSPIILILVFASVLSAFLHDATNASIILAIVLVSGLLGYWQERGAADAVDKLVAIIQVTSTVLRDGRPTEVAVSAVVPGDVVVVHAGDVIPGDSLVLDANSLLLDEAALTGETFPVEKAPGVVAAEAPLNKRTNALFTGTHVVSGTGTALVAATGGETEFGRVSESLKLRPPETEFERGIRQFGYLLMEVTLLLVISIFAINVYLHRPVVESFLFALALAVGLTPQLLPAIISVNLAHGAKRMAEVRVIVKRLAAIENFGSMDILCSDKTGTLTLGEVRLDAAVDADGNASDRTLLFAYLNACLQAGYTNPLDAAIRAYKAVDVSVYRKLGEVPYDFVRKRLSVLVQSGDNRLLITKGALSSVVDVCDRVETAGGNVAQKGDVLPQVQSLYEQYSAEGFRVIAVAYRDMGAKQDVAATDETGLTLVGLLKLYDPIKPGIVDTIDKLRGLGIGLKVITGDNRLVASHVGRQAGLSTADLLTGAEIRTLSQEALRQRAGRVDIFADVEPNQKERLIAALKQAGHVVGYIGDGINDASALHTADVGISVANAVDVAKEAADIVLLDKDLAVLTEGVHEGRTTFANTLKYVFMATSANFGNMFSMAGASLFLPFLPLLPTQVLLTNLMTDLPEMTIATDCVDPEMVDKPRRWDIGFIRRFMVVFGLANSACDYLTFGVLLLVLHASAPLFRTGWFIENVVTAALIVLVIRTRRPFYASRPGRYLLMATLATVAATIALPYTPLAKPFHFVPVPPRFLGALALIMVFYIVVAEAAKSFFYRRESA